MNFMINTWYNVFENEGATTDAGTPPSDATTATEEVSTPQAAEVSESADVSKKTFTQDDINKILAQEKRKHQSVTQKALQEVEALRKKSSLTEKERHELDERVDQLKTSLLTEQEKAKRQAEKLKQQHRERVAGLEAERDTWRTRYTDSTIQRSITDAAATNNAFNPRQIVAILGRNTRLVEDLDSEGSPTGRLVPKVSFEDKNKDGKTVVLELSPDEVIKRMKEIPEFLNLFKVEGTGGAGLRSQPSGKKLDIRELAKDPVAYRKAKAEGLI